MLKHDVRARIEELGIVPAIRVPSPDWAEYAAEALERSGIPVAEVTMTTPGAVDVIAKVAKSQPDMIVGGGTVLDEQTAKRCLDAGAKFLTSPGLVMKVVEVAAKANVVVFPGALTPTEVIAAWKAGVDFVKVYPCSLLGGPVYIRALKTPLPHVPLIASGGVNQQTISAFITAGATAVGIGSELLPRDALESRHEQQIRELGRRYLSMIRETRARLHPQ